MANYSKLTDFAAKDALPTGNAGKIVKGTEIDDEFEAIETAIATKPNSTDVDAAIVAARQAVWPIGSVYINAASATNPNTLLGFGTWVEIGTGKVLVGQDTGDTDFDVLGETGGSKDAVVVEHTHTATTDTAGNHVHQVTGGAVGAQSNHINVVWDAGSTVIDNTTAAGDHTHNVTVSSEGVDGTGKNVQPYVVVKMWQRTA